MSTNFMEEARKRVADVLAENGIEDAKADSLASTFGSMFMLGMMFDVETEMANEDREDIA